MADTIQIEGNRVHVFLTLDARIVVEGNRVHALVALNNKVQVEGNRIHALVSLPNEITIEGNRAHVLLAGPLTSGAQFGNVLGTIDRGNQVVTAAGLGGVLSE